jgi:hypothetical protein
MMVPGQVDSGKPVWPRTAAAAFQRPAAVFHLSSIATDRGTREMAAIAEPRGSG